MATENEMFNKPFADNGDREEVPLNSQADNKLSWEDGYTQLYGITPSEGGQFIRRKGLNQIFYMITKSITDLKVKISTALLNATNAEIENGLKIGNVSSPSVNLKSDNTSEILTPSVTAKDKEIVNAEWVRNFQAKKTLQVSNGYKIYTLIIELTQSETPNNCCKLADDAVGKSYDELCEFIGHYPCILRNNGIESDRLNPLNYAQTINNSTADITTWGNDIMVKFPRRGLNIRTIGTQLLISFTDDPNSSDFTYFAHTNGTISVDSFYMGAYLSSMNSSKLYSSSGKTPYGNATIATFRNYAQARGSGYNIIGWFQLVYIQSAFLLIHQNLNCKEAVGYGLYGHSSYTAYQSGATNTWGMDSKKIKETNPTYLTDGRHQIKALGLEDLWGNQWQFVDGIVTSNYNVMVSNGNFNSRGIGYVNAGIQCYAGYSSAWISSVAGNNLAGFYPTSCQGASQKYWNALFWQGANCVVLFGIHNGYSKEQSGLWALLAHYAASVAYADAGSRVMFLPTA